MRQSSQISKLTGFLAISLILGFGLSIGAKAEEPVPAVQAAPSKPAIDPAAGEALYNGGDATRGVVACITCHGPKGQSAVGTWPKLAGQHAAYIAKQLHNFKEGTRANAIMMGMAMPLTDQDMANIGAYLAKQTPSQGVAQNKDTIELGQSIYRGGIASKGVPACAACHSPNGAGIPAQYPLLSGQWADYTSAQLAAFHDGVRLNGPMMNTIAGKLSEKEMKAVADYMAGLH
ncbi:cytochrome c4 [Polynucleobacter paneuropaeus]|uniref:c-type cytochrome n=1 Tax=Polynucleobacter paneuropaeus TaxID=2527775 RepID=UPI001BFD3EE8|nr:c-type cytochrome [Polynucleobacter paneuropaeus]MBT8631011.1 cytochrome c4 [Polynucleobacter paneuropaeus]